MRVICAKPYLRGTCVDHIPVRTEYLKNLPRKKHKMPPFATFCFATIVAWEREKGTPPFKVVRQEGEGELTATTPLNP